MPHTTTALSGARVWCSGGTDGLIPIRFRHGQPSRKRDNPIAAARLFGRVLRFSGAAAGKTSSCPKRLSAGMLGSPCTESVSREEAGEGSRRAGTAEAAGRGGFCAGFSGGVAEAGLLRPSGAGFSTRFQSLMGWPPLSADLSVSNNDVLGGGQLPQPHRSAGMELLGRDADLRAQPEFGTVRKKRVEALR